MENRLEDILETTSYFVDRSQDILEVLIGRMDRLEANEETPTNLPSKDQQALRQDYDLLEFSKHSQRIQEGCQEDKGGLCRILQETLDHL